MSAGDDEDQQHFAGGFRAAPTARAAPAAAARAAPSAGRPTRGGSAGALASRQLAPPGSVRQLALVLRWRLGPRAARGAFSETPAHLPPTIARVWLSPRRPPRAGGRREHPVRRRRRRRHRAAHAARLPAGPARALRRRRSSSSTARTSPAGSGSRRRSPTSCSRRASTRSRSATTPTIAARSTPTSTPSRGSCARPTSCAASPATARAWSSATGVRLGVVNLSGNLYLRAGRSAFTEIEVALGELGERRPHPRRHARRGDLARRSRWAGTSTGA